MKIYVPAIEESYKDTIIGHTGNSGPVDLLLRIVQCRNERAAVRENGI